MARVRKILKNPPRSKRNYFLADASFLAEKYLPIGGAPTPADAQRTRDWREIDRQGKVERARVYVPDVCIAEAFKVLAKKYYIDSVFSSSSALKSARDSLSADITLSHKLLKKQTRYIPYHDLPTSRDVIVSIDRFYELFLKHRFNVGVIDLILVASAKYLMDFHDAKRSQIQIVTLDRPLWRGTKKVSELPNAYDPTQPSDAFSRIFE